MLNVFGHLPRASLALLPTPLERGPELPGGQRLWVKRDDLTGLGMGGNKVRKLEFLCGDAVRAGARSLVTVGAAQSNHCRLTAAAGAVLGIEVHLVLSGDRPERPSGNQLLSALFGAQLHYTGAHESHWGELMIAADSLADALRRRRRGPYSIPIGGSTATGALGYAVAFVEMMEQCAAVGHRARRRRAHVVERWHPRRARRRSRAVAVARPSGARGVGDRRGEGRQRRHPRRRRAGRRRDGVARPVGRASSTRPTCSSTPTGSATTTPCRRRPATTAMRWAATTGGWVLDRTYTGKGLAGLLGNAADGRWPRGADVIFVHTGGMPAVFAPGGTP